MPYVVTLKPDGSTSVHELVSECTTLGSKNDNNIVTTSKGVSRRHCHILKGETDYVIEDLNSTNFIFVEGKQVERHVLSDNMNFALGDYAKMLFLEEIDDKKIEDFVNSNNPCRSVSAVNRETRKIYKALPKSIKELEALIEVGSQITSLLDLNSVLETIIDKTLHLMNADRGFIMLLDNGILIPKVARNMDSDLKKSERFAFSKSFAQKVIEARKVLISTNVAEDPKFKSESIIAQRILSIMGAPLKHQNTILGCLYIDVKENLRFFSEQDSAFFSALANQAAIAIHNARLAESLRKNQIFLEQTNLQLQKSLEKLIETNLKLDKKINETSVLFDISKSLNLAADMDTVLKLIISKSRNILGAERASLMLYDPKLDGLVVELTDGIEKLPGKGRVIRSGEGIAGEVAKTLKGIIANKGSGDSRFKYTAEMDSKIKQMVCVPLITKEKCTGVINVINNLKNKDFTNHDLEILTSLANMASVSIEKFELYKDQLKQQRLNLELEDARTVQQLLLPKSMPSTLRFSFAAKYALANRVGGDYYDFIEIDEHRTGLVIADVSGHDIASALVMAMGRNLIRTLFQSLSSPAAILSKTSMILHEDTQAARYITMFLAILDSSTMTMIYSNGGHNYPMFLNTATPATYKPLSTGGFPLGLVDDYSYEEETIDLNDNDMLILYTDGLIEAQSPSGEMFELERLEQAIVEDAKKPLNDMVTNIYDKTLHFAETDQLEDDFTFVAMRVNPLADFFEMTIPSKLGNIPSYVDKISNFVNSKGYFTDDKFNLVLILKEILTNAIEHGNKLDESKNVFIRITPLEKNICITIRDEGTGFNIADTFAKQKKDLFSERGRGLVIIYEYADKVEFNESGNEIKVFFYRKT